MNDGLKITNFYDEKSNNNTKNSDNKMNDNKLNNENIGEGNVEDFENYYGRLKKKMDKNLENIFMNYFKMYLNKFDNFNNQLYLASIALEAYTNRINKVSSKINILNDFFKSGNEHKKKFLEKFDKLNKIDSKLSKLEICTQSLVSRIADFEKKVSNINLSDKSVDNFNQENAGINEVPEEEKEQYNENETIN